MKVAFFHDAPLYRGEDGNFYSRGFGYEIWERYLEYFDKVYVCTREANNIINDYHNFKISSGENVEFLLNNVYRNPIQLFTNRKAITIPISKVIEEVDCCIIRLPSVIGILAANECIKKNKPWCVEVVANCWDTLWNYGNLKGKLFAPILHLLTKLYISKAESAIYVSEKFLQKSYKCKGITFSASDVNVRFEDENIINKKVNRILNRDKTKQIKIGMIGSLNVEFKGHRTAIKTIKLLNDQGYNVVLECLGNGEKERWMKIVKNLKIENQVKFCGTLPAGEAVLNWLDEIDIFIMPSYTEGMPRSLIEAMSRGCNAIGSNVGGIMELLENDYLVSPKKYKLLAKKIINLIENPELSIIQAKRNYNFSKKYQKEYMEVERRKFLINFFENSLLEKECKINED